MFSKTKDKIIPETQQIKSLDDIKSPIHKLDPLQILEVAIKFNISFPFQYVDGEECLESLCHCAKDIEIDGRNFKIVPSAGALRIYSR